MLGIFFPDKKCSYLHWYLVNEYNIISQNQSSSWAVGSLYIFVCKLFWLVSLWKWNPWKLQLQLWKCMRSLESLWDFIHLPLTRQQVVCERPTSDAYVYAMHSHGNRFLILFQDLEFPFLLQISWNFCRRKDSCDYSNHWNLK